MNRALSFILHSETWRAALVLAALLLLFFEKPLRNFATHHYSTADITQDYTLTQIEPRYQQANRVTSDPAVEMQPWLMFNRDELRAGRIPLWNPYNGNGVPHLANMQSAVFSPFSLPFYLTSFRFALVATAFAKLFALGFFAYLFLRAIGLSFWPALISASAFMLCGHNIVLLAYPHTSATVALPAGLYFAESAIARWEDARSGRLRALAGLTFSLAAGVFAGQPESFYFAVLLIAFYAVFRLSGAYFERGRDVAALRHVLKVSAALLVSGTLAASLAAVQLLPFIEYLKHSVMFGARQGPQTPLAALSWPFLFFPNLLGNPAKPFEGWPIGPAPNFELVNSVYTSAIVVLLGLISIAWIRKPRTQAFFAILLTVWIVYAYDLFGIGRAIAFFVPLSDLAPINRSQPIGIFCVCVSAGYALEHLLSLDGPRRLVPPIFIAAVGSLLLWMAVAEAGERLQRHFLRFPPESAFREFARGHVIAMSALFAAGILLVSALAWIRARWARDCACALLLLLVFLPCGWMLRNYNPTFPDRFFFPRTESIEQLKSRVGSEPLLVFGDDTLPPDTNLVYGLRLPASYDALSIRTYDELYTRHFGLSDNWRSSRKASLTGLALLGIQHVLTKGAWIPAGTDFAGVVWNDARRHKVGPILPGQDVVQTFTATRERLQSILIPLSTNARKNRCTLRVALEEELTDKVLVSRDIDGSTLVQDDRHYCELIVDFDPIPDSLGKRYRLRLSSSDATATNAVSVWAHQDFAHFEEQALKKSPRAPFRTYTPGELTFGGVHHAGGVPFDCSYDRDRFREEARIGRFTLYAFLPGVFRYHVVDQAELAPSAEDSFERLLDRDFDAAKSVVLLRGDVEPANAVSSHDESSSLQLVSEEATLVCLAVTRSKPGWLVLAKPWYPGWKARVDGRETPLVRANYTFMALRVPAGANAIEIVYEPASFRIGAWISLASALACAVIGLTCTLRR